MAQEGIVLLKNDGLLPLSKKANIAVIGPNADEISVLLANYNGTPSRYTTLLRGIIEAGKSRVDYARGCDHVNPDDGALTEAVLTAKRCDAVVLCMGLTPFMEGEEGDAHNSGLTGDKPDLELPAVQKALFEAIAGTGKPVVFVNVSGSCINLVRADEACGAVIQCFYPGGEGGHALADILFGDVSPSGRLPVTFYRSADDLPPFEDYSMKNRTYRYFEGSPLYPFGHGLSYTTFSERWIDGSTLEIKNTGSCGSRYTALRYQDLSKRKLTGFRKVFLEKGQTVTISFE